MTPYYRVVRKAAKHIAKAIDHSVGALNEGRVEHEPAMTDRMLSAIEVSLSSLSTPGIRWSAKTLTDRGAGSQESKYGADFMGVLHVSLPELKVTKGFLAQAKLVRGNSSGDLKELKVQCEKMLNLSPASFVFLYGMDGVRVVPAISVLGSVLDPVDLYSRSAQRFFEEHLQCYIGDRGIDVATPAMLPALRERYLARSVLLMEATSKATDRES